MPGTCTNRVLVAVLIGSLLGVVVAPANLSAQPHLPPPEAPTAAPGGAQPVADPRDTPVPITLPGVLRLAQLANLDIARARAVVAQAEIAVRRAQVGWLPNVTLGSTYAHHEGNIQKTEGNIIVADKDSLFVGGGPSVAFQLSDALFTPIIARDLRNASEAGRRRVSNDTLLAVADAYFAVLRARRRLARVEETLDYLVSDLPVAARANSKGLLPLVRDFVEVGKKEALKSDLARVEVEVLRRDEERVAAVQDFRTASSELAQLLRLDPAVLLWPTEDFRYPIPIPGEEWLSRSVEELVTFALENRPELAESAALVRAAVDRVRAAQVRPLVPNVVVNYNWGGFGGGPDINPKGGFGNSGRILHFDTRTDFDASLVWRLDNLGLGTRDAIREQEVARRQATINNLQVQDRVAAQVIETQQQARDWRRRLDITRSALFDADGKPAGPVFRSLRLNFERIRGGEGRPLEVLDSIRGLSDLLEAYGQATTDYERSRFRLLIALGLSAETIVDALAPPNCETPR